MCLQCWASGWHPRLARLQLRPREGRRPEPHEEATREGTAEEGRRAVLLLPTGSADVEARSPEGLASSTGAEAGVVKVALLLLLPPLPRASGGCTLCPASCGLLSSSCDVGTAGGRVVEGAEGGREGRKRPWTGGCTPGTTTTAGSALTCANEHPSPCGQVPSKLKKRQGTLLLSFFKPDWYKPLFFVVNTSWM